MSFNRMDSDEDDAAVERLENFHVNRHGYLLLAAFVGLLAFILWAMNFRIDEVARAQGVVIASSHVQIIQAVDGGVLAELKVKEGDRVEPGQELARLNQTRIGANLGESEARMFSLRAKASRLRAEVIGGSEPTYLNEIPAEYKEIASVEKALFRQRRIGLNEELRTLKVAVGLAQDELSLLRNLLATGDVSASELLHAKRGLNDARAKLINRKNAFLEEARVDLTRVENELAETSQVLKRKEQEKQDSVFVAKVAGVVKNIRVTTVGGVMRAGEEIMQIIPVDDDLIIEAKVSPADIAKVRSGLDATLRFDPFDYTIFGGVDAKVTYVSADTLKEDTAQGQDVYYRAHIVPNTNPVLTTTGKTLEISPGMTAQVDIKTGDRTVMDFLLKPLKKTLTESLGER